jgi:hypothetical protein
VDIFRYQNQQPISKSTSFTVANVFSTGQQLSELMNGLILDSIKILTSFPLIKTSTNILSFEM